MPDVRKILVVDDEEMISWAISQALARKGETEVETASSGEEALEKLAREDFHLVITDIRMEGISGIELLTRVRAEYPSVEVVVMTAYGTEEAKRQASERGSLRYMEKPFEMEDLRRTVDDAFHRISGEGAEEGFSGQISNLSLVDMVQLHCLARDSVTLEVRTADNRGTIGFKDGEIVFGSTDDGTTGEDAVIKMLGWTGGDFETLDKVPEGENVQDSWEMLLLEASDVIASAAESSAQQKTAEKAPAAADTSTETVDMHEVLEALSIEQGVMGAFVAGSTGVLVDQVVTTYEGDLERISDLVNNLTALREIQAAIEPDVAQSRVIIQFEKARVLAMEISDTDLYLIVVNSGVGTLGRLVQLMTHACQQLGKLY